MLSDYLKVADTTTFIRIGCVNTSFDAGDMEAPQFFIDGYYSNLDSLGTAGTYVGGLNAPITGNLCVNGDFEMGTYGWTFTNPAGATVTLSEVDTVPGLPLLGKFLKIQVSNFGGMNCTVTPTIGSLPSELNGAPGFVRFFVATDPSSTGEIFIVTYPGALAPSRTINGTVIVPTTINSSTPVYFQINGNGTWYIQNFQVCAGNRGNNVPDGTAQRRWMPSANVEVQGSGPPTSGTWKVGDIVWNTAPTAGGGSYIGWVCTAAGTPGTWRTFGPVS